MTLNTTWESTRIIHDFLYESYYSRFFIIFKKLFFVDIQCMSFNTNQLLFLLKSSRFCPGMLLSFWRELLITAPEKTYHTPDSYSTVIEFLLLFIKVYLIIPGSKTQSIGWILDENVSSSWLRYIPPSKINNDQFDIIIDCKKENRLVCLFQKISFCSSFPSLQTNKKIVKNQER